MDLNALGFFGQPIGARRDPSLVSESGRPLFRDAAGNVFEVAPQPTRNALAARALMEAAQGGEAFDPMLYDYQPSSPLNALAALAQGAWDGVSAPGRAAAGEPVTYGDVWSTALDYGGVANLGTAPAGALRGGTFRAYHASPADFDRFDVTRGGRGASFFAATPEQARKGAGAGQNELARLASPQSSGAARMYEVEIDSDNILGMALTPKEREWWDGLPPQMTRDEFDAALGSAPSPEIINNWAFIFDEVATDPRKAAAIASSDYDAIDALGGLVDEDFVYVKGKNPPSLTWEDAQSKGRDVYGRQFPHYAPGSDEAGIAQRTLNRGMGGYLVQDEGGLSVAVANPDLVRIVRKYGIPDAAQIVRRGTAAPASDIEQYLTDLGL